MSNKTNRLLKKNVKKNSRKNTRVSPKTITENRHIKEGWLLILSAIAIFFLISFISYSPLDPGWSRTAQTLKIINITGRLGAWCADLFLYFFGITAYLLPVMILYFCYNVFINKDNKNSLLSWFLKLCGFIVTIEFSSALASLLTKFKLINIKLLMPVSLGGVFGDLLSNYLVNHAKFWGAFLILLPGVLAGLRIMVGLSWFKTIVYINNKIKNLLNFVIKKFLEINKKRGAIKKEIKDKESIVNKKVVDLNINNNELINNELIKNKDIVNNKNIINKELIDKDRYIAAKNFVQQVRNNKTNVVIKNINKNSNLPSIHLLEQSINDKINNYQENIPDPANIQAKLADFGIAVQITNIFPGPVVTRIEMDLAPGTKASRITNLSKDLARSLSVPSVRVVEVIPGKSVVGLEIPNKHRALVRLRDVLSSEQYLTSNAPLTLALGKDIAGTPIVVDLSRMPHLLIAGTTGSGKSVGVNTMLLSILFKVSPEEVRLILIDPKMLELSIYEGIPHLLTPVVTDMKDAANVLNWCVFEMERRYKLMAGVGVRNLLSFNHKVQTAIINGNPIPHPFYNPNIAVDQQNKQYLEKLPCIVVIIDEFADMMMVVGKKVEEQIARIAQKARAAGIHMILATQRPSVDVITGLIKANIPTRISFQVSSRIDSRTILDQQGAEQLLGNGDLLYLPPGSGIPIRIHGAFVSDDEVHKVVASLKSANSTNESNNYMLNIEQIQNVPDVLINVNNSNEEDSLYDEAVAIITSSKKASISYLQRRLKIGFNRAANLIEEMQRQGIVSAVQSNGAREVLVASPPGGTY